VPLYWAEKVSIHGLTKYKYKEYGMAFMVELFFQVLKNLVVCLVEWCSDGASQHYYTLQWAQKMCIINVM